MSDKMIETTETADTILIDENPKDLKYLWSRLKESPNKWAWLGLLTITVSLPMMVPYVFFGSYATIYFVGVGLLALVLMYIGFASNFGSNLFKLNLVVFFFMSVIALSSIFQTLNFDKHVFVNYHESVEGFSYGIITKELSNPLLGDTESFTILVKSEDLKFKGPDFENLVTKIHSGSKEYYKGSLEEFKPFTIYYGSDSKGKTGDIKGKRTVYGWFGSTSTDFVIELER